jgi:hypothetical protein
MSLQRFSGFVVVVIELHHLSECVKLLADARMYQERVQVREESLVNGVQQLIRYPGLEPRQCRKVAEDPIGFNNKAMRKGAAVAGKASHINVVRHLILDLSRRLFETLVRPIKLKLLGLDGLLYGSAIG